MSQCTMSQSRAIEDHAELSVENVGGIDATEITFSPGVTSLTGRNATNRTSLLQALMATLGSERVSLKGDADHGEVELTLGDDTYTRTLERRNGTVVFDGDPYLEDTEAAELFAFLLESNEARQAVARDDDLREVIMRPVDTAAINAEIEQLEAEKRDLDDELDRLESLDSRLPELEAEKTRLEDRIEDKRTELDAKESEIEDADQTVDDTREQKNAFEDALDELQEVRSELEDVRYRIDTERESIQALEDERDELETTMTELPETPAGDLDELETEIDRLRDHKQSLESTINQLQRILQFNEELLEGDNPELQAALQNRSDDGEALTDQLVEDTTVCWTCGSEVERDAIDDTLDGLRELRSEHSSKRNEIDAELDELTDRRDALRGDRDQRERVDRKLDEIDREISQREATLDDLTDERSTLEDTIDEREAAVEELEGQEQSELLDHHKEANQLEFELGRLESDLEDVREEIASVEEDLDERDRLTDRREELQTELADLRTRIEQLEAEAVEEFNDHMETILGVLDYANIERIWIERTEQTVREGRRKVERGVFDLHVIRSTNEGTTYEDSIGHLSESEREVTGLVFALAGYLVHDLHESLPFIVIDSLEALDSDRIAALVEYFGEYATYLVVALLPEDAAALSDEYQRVTDI
ncbi:Chromosome segregation protein (Spc25, Csm1, Pcs1) [Halococcus saccharolyticus DSM 5350]|uniref:Chromosome segregation protein (Spc25, Csm1, Pcs1) n=2 Tax=Halococcus saccharolyticus TaxID=62319 RepID=M0MQZ7_9EURY|nr:Chromosome segregation protein (Spc25, Csm1, Pcs1) [Halococcus saccharolyticus DSM 5350]